MTLNFIFVLFISFHCIAICTMVKKTCIKVWELQYKSRGRNQTLLSWHIHVNTFLKKQSKLLTWSNLDHWAHVFNILREELGYTNEALPWTQKCSKGRPLSDCLNYELEEPLSACITLLLEERWTDKVITLTWVSGRHVLQSEPTEPVTSIKPLILFIANNKIWAFKWKVRILVNLCLAPWACQLPNT